MPTYEYQCNNCHHAFELMQKISEDPIKKCPECGKLTVIRLVSAAGFQLKGTGWYVTDFKNKGQPKAAVQESDTSAPSVDKKTEPAAESSKPKGDDN